MLRKLLLWRFGWNMAFPYPPGQLYSPTEALAEKLGVRLVEYLLSRSAKPNRRLLESFEAFVKDPGLSRLALRKSLHRTVEERLRTLALRADPPETHGHDATPVPSDVHALDGLAAEWLRKNGVDVAAAPTCMTVSYAIRVVALAATIAARAFGVLRAGRLGKVTPVKYRLLILNASREDAWLSVITALGGRLSLTVEDCVVECKANWRRNFKTLSVIDPTSLPVPLITWLTAEAIPMARLMIAVSLTAVRSTRAPESLVLCESIARLAGLVVEARRLASNIRFEFCFDDQEYSAKHIVMAAVFRPLGGRLVRWPHSEMDTFGSSLSFLGYDLFLSAGPYQERFFGQTWDRSGRAASVGYIQHDSRFVSAPVRTPEMASIRSRIAAGERLIVVFGPSSIPGIFGLFRIMLRSLADCLHSREGWFVVIKPKGKDDLYSAVSSDPQVASFLHDQRVMPIHYSDREKEPSSSGFLIENMDFCLTYAGTPMIESLAAGKRALALSPIGLETPFRRWLAKSGLLHENEASLSAAISSLLDNPEPPPLELAWFREFFGFSGGEALERVSEALSRNKSSTVVRKPSCDAESPRAQDPEPWSSLE